jgi:syntaxin-binding protein 1
MDTIRSIQPPEKWKIIVVDSKSALILNAACKMYDILEENVSFDELYIIVKYFNFDNARAL